MNKIVNKFLLAEDKFMAETHPATRRRSDVVTTSLCTSQ